MATWIVVAHRAGCRLLSSPGRSTALTLLEEIEHPQGRFQNHQIDSDKQGAFDSGGKGRSGYSPPETSHDHVARVFAADIAKRLEQGRNSHAFSTLVLVAEPRFLGMLREALSAHAAKIVRASVAKDLYLVPTAELGAQLEETLHAL